MKIFDIHVHIYPDRIAQKASESIGIFYDGFPIRGNGSLDDCISRMDLAGVQMFAAHSVAMNPHNVESINRFIMEAHAKYPDRIVPFAALHPDMQDIPAAALLLLGHPVVHGIGLRRLFRTAGTKQRQQHQPAQDHCDCFFHKPTPLSTAGQRTSNTVPPP